MTLAPAGCGYRQHRRRRHRHHLGGPGAVFWMWMVAFLGASSAFVESTLGQVYKGKSTASTVAVRRSTSRRVWA